jgi:hypothetical protein
MHEYAVFSMLKSLYFYSPCQKSITIAAMFVISNSPIIHCRVFWVLHDVKVVKWLMFLGDLLLSSSGSMWIESSIRGHIQDIPKRCIHIIIWNINLVYTSFWDTLYYRTITKWCKHDCGTCWFPTKSDHYWCFHWQLVLSGNHPSKHWPWTMLSNHIYFIILVILSLLFYYAAERGGVIIYSQKNAAVSCSRKFK